MRNWPLIRNAISLSLALVIQCVHAAPEARAKSNNTEVVGKWQIDMTIDKMTDKPRCAMYYRNSKVPAVVDNAIYIAIFTPGTPDHYQQRIGTAPATTRLAGRIEKEEKIVNVWLPDEDLGDAKRLMVRGQTILGKAFDYEVDLTGFREARAKFLERCPPA